jgi:hypothetical protein
MLFACDMLAATFSENSINAKTKRMKSEANELRSVIQGMGIVAQLALGEETGGGLFGFGANNPSKDELSRKMDDLYIQGGTAWNWYIFDANEGLPIQLQKLPFL